MGENEQTSTLPELNALYLEVEYTTALNLPTDVMSVEQVTKNQITGY